MVKVTWEAGGTAAPTCCAKVAVSTAFNNSQKHSAVCERSLDYAECVAGNSKSLFEIKLQLHCK